MRILYIYRYGILGGVSTQLANRLRFLTSCLEAHFAFLHDYGGRTAFGDYPNTHILPSVRSVREFIRAGDFDIVLPIDTPESFKAIRESKYKGLVVNEVHTTTANLQYLKDVQKERIDAFLAPSDYVVQRIEGEFGYGGKVPCFKVSNCLDTALFQPQSLGVSPERRIVLWVGKLDDHKNWRGYLEVASALSQLRGDCEFWMVGGETAKDEVALQLFEAASESSLLPRLRWIQRVEYHQMPRIYSLVAASGGLTLSTSRDESFGMTVAESLACGCPAVASAVGGIPEVLAGDLAVGLYPFFDVEAATAAVHRLLDEADCRRKMVEIGRRRVETEYSIESAGRRYLDVLETICDLAAPGQGGEDG